MRTLNDALILTLLCRFFRKFMELILVDTTQDQLVLVLIPSALLKHILNRSESLTLTPLLIISKRDFQMMW